MKILAWTLVCLSSLANLDFIWRLVEGSFQLTTPLSTTPLLSVMTFVFIQQSFPNHSRLVLLSKINLGIFLVYILVRVASYFF